MLLKIGSTGDDVKKLQARLGVANTGTFATITDAKVKEWQTLNNLSANGIVDDLVWGLLFPAAGQNGSIASSGSFNLDKLKGHIPETVLSQIPVTASKFNITSVLRLAHFLAQCGHESGGFLDVYEKLNYTAERLRVIFPKYFPGTLSESYAHNPEKIASRVYASRMGNGDEASGDGFKYRGRGFIQLTGKNNYTSFAGFIGEDTVNNPDLVATKYPLASAAFYFNSNKLWTICDGGVTEAIISTVTKRINGKLIGLPDRIKHFNEYYSLLK